MAGQPHPDQEVAPGSTLGAVGALALALAVFLGGVTMTSGWIALFFAGASEPDPAKAPADRVALRLPARRLLWLVFDAMRADAAFDPTLMPNLAELRRRGVWGVARTGSFTMTGTCVRALGTGASPLPTHVIHNFRSPPIRGDSLFRRVHRAGRRVVLIGDHIWVDLYRNTVSASFPQPDLGINDVDRTDGRALADARRLLPGGWDLVVLHLVGSDHAAHKERGVRGLYRRKLAAFDRHIPELRRLMGPDAAVLVIADHACNGSGSHGAGEPEATRAPYVLAGPGVLALGRRDVDQRALAPTVAALMGVGAPWTAQVPGLLDALDLTEAQRSGLALNHAFGRAAHLRAKRGQGDQEVSALLTGAARARAAGRHRKALRLSAEVISRVAALDLAHSRSSRWLWLAVLSLLLSVPGLLLVGSTTIGRGGPRAWAAAGWTLLLSALGVVLVFTLSPRISTVAGALLLAVALAGWLTAWGGFSLLRLLPLALASFALATLGAWVLDWLRRLWQGDPTGQLWLALPGLAAVLCGLGWVWATGRFRRGLEQHPGLLAGLATAVLFLPLPFLRWWGGRHLVVGFTGVAAAAGVVVWGRGRGLLTWRVVAGFAALAGSVGLGLALGFGRGLAPDARMAVAVALGAPAAIFALGGLSRRALLSAATLVTMLAWVVAQLPRLGLLSPYFTLLLSAVALLVVLVVGRGSGAHLALLCLATLRVLAPDQVVAATTLFGAGVLGMARLGRRPGALGTAALAVLMVLAELVVFYQLGREFAFGTIDVRIGFVGGGEIDLVRITLLILLANATPWWLLFAAALDLSRAGGRGARAWLDGLLQLQLWILAVKVLGTFLLFAGRPTHFWLIHSLIPFQFFGLANLIMIVTGYCLARSLLRSSAGGGPGGVRGPVGPETVSGSTRRQAAPAQ